MLTPLRVTIFCCASLILGLVLGLAFPFYFNVDDHRFESFQEIRQKGNYRFINPLLECDSADFSQMKSMDHLREELNNAITNRVNSKDISFAAVYYRDLNNGPWLGINQDELFSPSSLIKVPLMIAYLKLSESDPSVLQKQFVNTKPYDPSDQNFIPEKTLDVGGTYTVSELLDRMIIYSDNLAYDLLFSNLNNKDLIRVYTDLGVDLTKAYEDPNGNIISVKSYASFFRMLFNSSYLSKDNSEFALNLLSQSKFTQGIVSGVPSTVTVAHKFGERQYMTTHQKQLHDCGIVYADKPYLLCVMTRGADFAKMTNAIGDISKKVYYEISP